MVTQPPEFSNGLLDICLYFRNGVMDRFESSEPNFRKGPECRNSTETLPVIAHAVRHTGRDPFSMPESA